MKSFVLVVSLVISGVVCVADGPATTGRVRALDAWAAESLDRIATRSPLARQFVHRLEASNLIVHIVTASVMPSNLAGTTRFVLQRAGYRYVRVTIDVSDAVDHDGVRRLYERIGKPVDGRDHFETSAAALAGRRVWSELHESSGVSWSK